MEKLKRQQEIERCKVASLMRDLKRHVCDNDRDMVVKCKEDLIKQFALFDKVHDQMYEYLNEDEDIAECDNFIIEATDSYTDVLRTVNEWLNSVMGDVAHDPDLERLSKCMAQEPWLVSDTVCVEVDLLKCSHSESSSGNRSPKSSPLIPGKSRHQPQPKSPPRSVNPATSYGTVPPCVFCGERHRLYLCSTFKALKAEDKFDVIVENKLCENCLLDNHSVHKCFRPSMCGIYGCKLKHSRFIHFVKVKSEIVQSVVCATNQGEFCDLGEGKIISEEAVSDQAKSGQQSSSLEGKVSVMSAIEDGSDGSSEEFVEGSVCDEEAWKVSDDEVKEVDDHMPMLCKPDGVPDQCEVDCLKLMKCEDQDRVEKVADVREVFSEDEIKFEVIEPDVTEVKEENESKQAKKMISDVEELRKEEKEFVTSDKEEQEENKAKEVKKSVEAGASEVEDLVPQEENEEKKKDKQEIQPMKIKIQRRENYIARMLKKMSENKVMKIQNKVYQKRKQRRIKWLVKKVKLKNVICLHHN